MKLIVFLLLLLIALGVWEMLRHVWHRRKIPIRIHVNGSRGKSSVARLIAAGLRAGGIRVVGKTTGSTAAIVHVDGSESPVPRRGGPNIREQLGVIREAVSEKCEALVIECMAVRPDLQYVCEHHIIKSTHGIITNVRPDHLEVMGPTMDDVAASLAGTVPKRAHLYTSEDIYPDFLEKRATKAKSGFTCSDETQVSVEEMAGFTYVEFPENVSLALAVCADLGVERDSALQGMWGVTPDVGALTTWCYINEEQSNPNGQETIDFVNGFAANDPVSYIKVWNRLGLNERPDEVIMLMNIRADRQRRSKDLAPLFGRELKACRYALIGEETAIFTDMLRRQGIPADQISDLSKFNAKDLWIELSRLAPSNCTVIGVGNIAGIGNRLLAYLRRKELAA